MATAPEPLNIVATTQYVKDAKKVRKRGKNMTRLLAVVDALEKSSSAC